MNFGKDIGEVSEVFNATQRRMYDKKNKGWVKGKLNQSVTMEEIKM